MLLKCAALDHCARATIFTVPLIIRGFVCWRDCRKQLTAKPTHGAGLVDANASCCRGVANAARLWSLRLLREGGSTSPACEAGFRLQAASTPRQTPPAANARPLGSGW